VRVQGTMTEAQKNMVLKRGVELEDGVVKFDKLEDQGGEGYNHWYLVVLKEGRNRVVRRTFDVIGFPVSRLMRVRFGIINLPPRLKRGMSAELTEGEVTHLLEWVGLIDSVDQSSENAPSVSQTSRVNFKKWSELGAKAENIAGSNKQKKSKAKGK